MVVVRGVNLHPGAFEDVIRRFEMVAEYCVECFMESALLEVRVHLEPAAGCPDAPALGGAVEAALRSAFNLRVPVTLVPPGTLPRPEMKSQRWVRLGEGKDRG